MRDRMRRNTWAKNAPSPTAEGNRHPKENSQGIQRTSWLGSLALPLFSLLLFAGLIYIAWESISMTGVTQDFILPSPLQVAQAFGAELGNGDLLSNTAVTLQEAFGGFVVAAVIAGVSGYTIAHMRWLEIISVPFIAASQAIPAVAIAPLIILLLHTGLLPKLIVSAVIVVFPLLITTITGLRGVERDYLDAARVFGASWVQTLFSVELPLAAPTLLSGLKLGVTLSITGAVVGEFVSADSGLGFMINSAIGNFETANRYVALVSLALLSMILFSLVTLMERILLRWYDA